MFCISEERLITEDKNSSCPLSSHSTDDIQSFIFQVRKLSFAFLSSYKRNYFFCLSCCTALKIFSLTDGMYEILCTLEDN